MPSHHRCHTTASQLRANAPGQSVTMDMGWHERRCRGAYMSIAGGSRMSEQPLRVLLALDDTSLRELFAKYLCCECGYLVDPAATGDALRAQIDGAQGQYDVVVLDDRL